MVLKRREKRCEHEKRKREREKDKETERQRDRKRERYIDDGFMDTLGDIKSF